MKRFGLFLLALCFFLPSLSCKTDAYQMPDEWNIDSIPMSLSAKHHAQSLDADQFDNMETLSGLGRGLSADRLGQSAWSKGKIKISANCQESFQVIIEDSNVRSVTNFQKFDGCLALARLLDNLELPSRKSTKEIAEGGSTVTSSCHDEYFTLDISEYPIHISSEYVVPNQEACQELRNLVNGAKL